MTAEIKGHRGTEAQSWRRLASPAFGRLPVEWMAGTNESFQLAARLICSGHSLNLAARGAASKPSRAGVLRVSISLWRSFAGYARAAATDVNHGEHCVHGDNLSKRNEAAYWHLPLENGVSVFSVPSVVAFRLQREISL